MARAQPSWPRPRLRTLEARILSVRTGPKIPPISRSGSTTYKFWKAPSNRPGLWRRTTLRIPQAEPPGRRELTRCPRGGREGEPVWNWGPALNRLRARLVSLSKGGAGSRVTREFNLKTKTFIDGGYACPRPRARAAWRGVDSVLWAPTFGRVRSQRRVPPDRQGGTRWHARWRSAETVYECRPTNVSLGLSRPDARFEPRLSPRRKNIFTSEERPNPPRGRKVTGERCPTTPRLVRALNLHPGTLRTNWAGGKTEAAGR